jgi:hypothetical protein
MGAWSHALGDPRFLVSLAFLGLGVWRLVAYLGRRRG